MLNLLLYFLAGFCAFNSLPHIISGIMGNKHMTPLGKDTSAVMNVIWGFVNLGFALVILRLVSGNLLIPAEQSARLAFIAGGFVLSVVAANMFSNPNAKMPWWK